MQRKELWVDVGAIGTLAFLVPVIGSLWQPFMIDDAYVTYSYARSFANSFRLEYYPSHEVLSTSAPFYAILLGIIKRTLLVNNDIPQIGLWVSTLSIFGTAVFLYLHLRRHSMPVVSAVAALLFVTSPIIWLTLGMETPFFVMTISASVYFFERHPYLSGLISGLSAITRADGVLIFGLQLLDELLLKRSWKRVLIRSAAFLSIAGPMIVGLVILYGSPIPVTLSAKQNQLRVLGITGFYDGSTMFRAIEIIIGGLLQQSSMYWFALVLSGLGFTLAYRSRQVRIFWLWPFTQFFSYAALGVAPYFWYFAPLSVFAAVMSGMAFSWGSQKTENGGSTSRRVYFSHNLKTVILLALFIGSMSAQIQSIWRDASSFTERSIPDPTIWEAKVLPEAKGAIYRQIGEWLNQNSSPDATVGAVEVGIIGYYANRKIVDFLGLLQPDISNAIGRGDLYYALANYMPDYLVMSASSYGIYNLWLGDDAWFTSNYQLVKEFHDERFWGSPLGVLRRKTAYMPPVEEEFLGHNFFPGLTLLSFGTDHKELEPGDSLRVRLEIRYTASISSCQLQIVTYLVDPQGTVRDLRAFSYDSSVWPNAKSFIIYEPILLSPNLTPGVYQLRVRAVTDECGLDSIVNLTSIKVKQKR